MVGGGIDRYISDPILRGSLLMVGGGIDRNMPNPSILRGSDSQSIYLIRMKTPWYSVGPLMM